MKLNIYSVFDAKAAVYGTPFFTSNDGTATRMFIDLVNDSRSTVSRYPEDFTLYRIGVFDDSVATVEGNEPAPVITAAACVKPLPIASDAAKALLSRPVEVPVNGR